MYISRYRDIDICIYIYIYVDISMYQYTESCRDMSRHVDFRCFFSNNKKNNPTNMDVVLVANFKLWLPCLNVELIFIRI